MYVYLFCMFKTLLLHISWKKSWLIWWTHESIIPLEPITLEFLRGSMGWSSLSSLIPWATWATLLLTYVGYVTSIIYMMPIREFLQLRPSFKFHFFLNLAFVVTVPKNQKTTPVLISNETKVGCKYPLKTPSSW